MSASKEAVLALARQGVPPREIKARFPQLTLGSVYCWISWARQEGEPIPHFKGGGSAQSMIRIPAELRKRLKSEAEARALTYQELVEELLSIIVNDGLFAAILDDGGIDG